MRYEDALKATGGDSCGGQLIVHFHGKNVFVGKHLDGHLLVEDTDEARAVMAEAAGSADAVTDQPVSNAAGSAVVAAPKTRRTKAEMAAAAEAALRAQEEVQAAAAEAADDAAQEGDEIEPVHHQVQVSDELITADAMGGAE